MAKQSGTGPATISIGGKVIGVIPTTPTTPSSGTTWHYTPPSSIDCLQCGKNMGYVGSPRQTYVHIEHNPHLAWQSGLPSTGHPSRTFTLCPECAGYLLDQQRFKNLQDYIVESTPYLKGMPSLILADYLEEHGAEAAEWIRKHTSGG